MLFDTGCINKLKIDRRLWKMLEEFFNDVEEERGVYLVGSIYGGNALVYEIFEVSYLEHSPVHLISDPTSKLLLENSLPPGLSILGIIHNHPRSIGAKLSLIDLELAQEHENFAVVAVDDNFFYDAKVFCEGELKDIALEIELAKSEMPAIAVFEDCGNKNYLVLPQVLLKKIPTKILLKRYYPQFAYRIYIGATYESEQVTRNYKWCMITQIFSLPHVILPKENKFQYNYLSKQKFVKSIETIIDGASS